MENIIKSIDGNNLTTTQLTLDFNLEIALDKKRTNKDRITALNFIIQFKDLSFSDIKEQEEPIKQPESFVKRYDKPYKEFIDIMKGNGGDNFFCNSINYMINTFVNNGVFTRTQSELSPEQIQAKENFLRTIMDDIKPMTPQEILLKVYNSLIVLDPNIDQTRQLNHSLKYLTQNKN